MDESHHPLATSPPTFTDYTFHDTTSTQPHPPSTPQPITESRAFYRGRSKSYGWTMAGLPPRLPVDYQFGTIDTPTTHANHVPYKARSWEPTLEQAIKAIVSIKANHVRSFDTETSGVFVCTCEKKIVKLTCFIRWIYCNGFHCRRFSWHHTHQSPCRFTCSHCRSSCAD